MHDLMHDLMSVLMSYLQANAFCRNGGSYVQTERVEVHPRKIISGTSSTPGLKLRSKYNVESASSTALRTCLFRPIRRRRGFAYLQQECR